MDGIISIIENLEKLPSMISLILSNPYYAYVAGILSAVIFFQYIYKSDVYLIKDIITDKKIFKIIMNGQSGMEEVQISNILKPSFTRTFKSYGEIHFQATNESMNMFSEDNWKIFIDDRKKYFTDAGFTESEFRTFKDYSANLTNLNSILLTKILFDKKEKELSKYTELSPEIDQYQICLRNIIDEDQLNNNYIKQIIKS